MNIDRISMLGYKDGNMPEEPLALSSSQMPGHVTLGYYIARLAEEIVLNENSCQCDMCEIGSCDSQVSGATCLNGVAVWLLDQAEAYARDAAEREASYFPFLDSLSDTQLQNAVSLMETRFPHFKTTICGARVIFEEWQARKGREAL